MSIHLELIDVERTNGAPPCLSMRLVMPLVVGRQTSLDPPPAGITAHPKGLKLVVAKPSEKQVSRTHVLIEQHGDKIWLTNCSDSQEIEVQTGSNPLEILPRKQSRTYNDQIIVLFPSYMLTAQLVEEAESTATDTIDADADWTPNPTSDTGVVDPAALSGTIEEVRPDVAVCWLEIAPGTRVKFAVPLIHLRHLDPQPGLELLWSPGNEREVPRFWKRQPEPPDPEMIREVRELGQQFRESLKSWKPRLPQNE